MLSYTYDADGTKLSGGGRGQSYEPAGMVAAVTEGANTVSYTYSTENQRALQVTASETDHLCYAFNMSDSLYWLTFLVTAGKNTPAALDRVQRLHTDTGDPLDVILARPGVVAEADISRAFAETLNIPMVQAADLPSEPLLFTHLRPGSSVPILRRVAPASEIERWFDRLYGAAAQPGPQQIPVVDASDDLDRLRDLASDAPVIRLVNRWLNRAVEAGASDIHMEPQDDALRMRLRIDGVLAEPDTQPAHLQPAVVSRLKIMARLDIRERRPTKRPREMLW